MNAPARPDGSPLTDTALAEIEARVNAATQGPWEVDDRGSSIDIESTTEIVCQIDSSYDAYFDRPGVEADAAFIAHARTDVPALLAEVRRGRQREEALTRIAEQQQKTLRMIQDNGFVFESIGQEPGNWQHLAFTIYTDLCEVDTIARNALGIDIGEPVVPLAGHSVKAPEAG